MPNFRAIALTLVAILASCGGVPETAVEHPFVVDAAWLRAHRSEVVVVGMHKSREAFEKGHVPGAAFAKVDDFRTEGKLLKPTAELERRLGELGIDENTHVVIYGDRDGYGAGWLWFTLNRLGHGAVSLLDGNLSGWDKLETGPPAEIVAKIYRARQEPNDIVDADYLHARMGRAVMLDARVPEQYTGDKPKKGMLGSGHVPGAINVPWNTFHEKDGGYVGETAAGNALASKLGREPPKDAELILYCNSYKAAANLHFQLARLGYTNIKAYDGSMKDWEKRGLPLKKGSQP